MKKNNNLKFILKVPGAGKDLVLRNDPVRFQQIITNLLNNAVKYTEKGSVEFGYTCLKGEIEFFVADTGIGISQQYLVRIFDHFHKIDNPGNKIFPGAGIGLAICKNLVKLMGGRIWAESELGKGSVFRFTLPDKRPAASNQF